MYREEMDHPVLVVAFYGRVFGLDRRTGTIAWELSMKRAGGTTEIAIAHGLLYAICLKRFAIVEYPSGRVLHEGELPFTYPTRATLVVQGDLLFVGSGGEVVALSRNGQVLWKQEFEGKGVAAIALGFPGNIRQADVTGS